MRFLVTEKLSSHKYKTPEGYLICTDAILSRTGKQEYKRSEIFGDACDEPDKIVNVDRTDAEVFDDKAMASFENKPICIEHPDEDVNVENHNDLSVGFVRDIHKGEDNGKPVMMGTLVITDKDAVKAVESGEYKELSCGYDCDIADEDGPQQRNIRGNHVALCKQGRAGIARIVDSVKITDNDIEWLRALDRYGIKFSFINGGYSMKFNSNADYIIAKRLANQYKMKNGYWDDNARIYSDYHSTIISQDDSVNDLTFNRMTEEAKKLKEELGMYARQAGSHKSTGVVPYKTRQSGPQVKELNEAINEAIQQLQNGVRDKSAWNRLAIKLEAWEDDPEMTSVAKRAAKAIRKFEAFIGDSDMKDIQSTKAPGTDKIIYVMQSDIDKNLYFYIGKTFSMKEGNWGYTKFEMGNTTPDELKSELARNGWHQVTNGPARIIDASNEEWTVVEEENYKKANKPVGAKDEEYVQLPRGRFKVVTKTKEELEKEGYGYHHSDRGYSVYVKNNQAVAIKDSIKEKLFTVEYIQGDTTYICKVKANTIQDAIEQVKRKLTDEFNENTIKSKPFNVAIDLLKRNGFEIKYTGISRDPAGSYTDRSIRSAFVEATNSKTFERVLAYAPISSRVSNVTKVTSEVNNVTVYKYKDEEQLRRYTLHK